MRVSGFTNAHLIIQAQPEGSLAQADQEAKDIVNWLIYSLHSRTIYFLWEQMKAANERYGLEGPMQAQRRELDELNSREVPSRES
jgi:hypothetical protein